MYRDLHELLMRSSSTCRYFTSLPVEVQMDLHRMNSSIRTAEQLHRWAGCRQNGLPDFPQAGS